MPTSPAFNLFYDSHLSLVEGGVVDNDLDKGGATWYGISSGFLKTIGRQGPLSKSDAKKIAFDYFWEPNELDEMNQVAAWSYCDALFNHSQVAATRIFQVGLGVEADGVMGPKTREAAKSINQKLFIERYRVARTRYYTGLVKSDSTQLEFMVGWIDRVHRLNQALLTSGLLKGEITKLPWYTSSTAKATGWGVAITTIAATIGSSEAQGFIDWLATQFPQFGVLGVVGAWLAKHNFKEGIK